MTLRSIWHMFGKGVTLVKIREASLDSIAVSFYSRSLFCDLVPNLFERLFLSAGLLTLRTELPLNTRRLLNVHS